MGKKKEKDVRRIVLEVVEVENFEKNKRLGMTPQTAQ